MSGPCLSSSVADRPLRPATRRSLGGPLPRQRADGPRAHPRAIACIQRPPFPARAEAPVVSSGISTPFGELFRTLGQITHVLLTRAPLYSPLRAFSLDLHVLGTPPAFVLSQDQTLQKDLIHLFKVTQGNLTGVLLKPAVPTAKKAVWNLMHLFSFQRPCLVRRIAILAICYTFVKNFY